MAYIAAADFREKTVQPYTANLVLDEGAGTDAYLDLVIAQMTAQVEIDLNDEFEPPNPDNNETIKIDNDNPYKLYIPRRVRSIASVQTRSYQTMTTQASTTYYHRRSLNSTGDAMVNNRKHDWLEPLPGLTVSCWPTGGEAVWITGTFGWSAVPDDIKRLVALRVYDQIKSSADPLSNILQRNTLDAQITYGPSREALAITQRYQRDAVFVG